jgi:hypothetical protein
MCLCFVRKELIMSRWFWMLLGLFLALFGTGIVLPVLSKLKQLGALPAHGVVPLMSGVAILVLGLCLLAYGIVRLFRGSASRRIPQ